MHRRQALRMLALGAPAVFAVRRLSAQQGQQGVTPPPTDSILGELVNPEWAGRSQGRVTSYDNDPFVVAVEQKLRCTCGCNLSVYTCRTTDFTCTTSPEMHRRVVQLVKEKMSAQQILDAFVAQHGETVLMAPPKTGFNLAAYYVPRTLIVLVAGVLLTVFARRVRARGAQPVAADYAGLSPEDAARLETELRQLDR